MRDRVCVCVCVCVCESQMRETRWERERRLGKPAPNPFTKQRAANQTDRFLNKRQAAEWRGTYDRAGNPAYITLR